MGPSIIACGDINGTGPRNINHTHPVVVNNFCDDGDFVGMCTRPEEDHYKYANSMAKQFCFLEKLHLPRPTSTERLKFES